jgi:Fe-Mn family superoxide dismutase
MNKQIIAKPLKDRLLAMDGISENQIREHYTLYEGYVKKINEVREKLKNIRPEELQAANQSYSYLRALKVAETFAANGVTLHEDYFGNLGGEGTKAISRVEHEIKKRFGSVATFKNYFSACGMAVRGWVTLVWDHFTNSLRIYGSDVHDFGSVWRATPILVMDVYEHAYMIDYGVKRPPYIEAFVKNIDWEEVARRLEAVVKH